MITAALPYANGLKHIGHLAGAYLPADIYVRYLKAQKRDVVFVCGSDEHGTAIPIQATKEGTTAQAIIDKYHPIIEQNFKDLGIAFDLELSDLSGTFMCPVFNIELERGTRHNFRFSPSVDRIDPTKGYTKDNIQIISWKANRLKAYATVEDLEAVLAFMKQGD